MQDSHPIPPASIKAAILLLCLGLTFLVHAQQTVDSIAQKELVEVVVSGNKFAEKKKGAAIKEAYRQEKRKNKADARAAGEEMRARKKAKARGEEYVDPKKTVAPPRTKSIDKSSASEKPARGAAKYLQYLLRVPETKKGWETLL